MTEDSLPQSRPSDIDVFVAMPKARQAITPTDMVDAMTNLLEKNPHAAQRLRGIWESKLAYWQRVAAADAEVQREGWAAVKQSLGMDDGVRR